MGKLITLLLGMAVVFGLGYWAVTGTTWGQPKGEPPKQQLQHVRDTAKKIEDDAASRAQQNLNRGDHD